MQYKFKFNLHSSKTNFNIVKWAQKIMNIYHKPIHHDHCLHKKFWSHISIWWSVGLKNLTDSFTCLWNFFGIPHPVTNICDNFCEIFSIFFHSLDLWYHAFTTNFIIFRLRLSFIEFKIYSATNSLLCFPNKMFDFLFKFLEKSLKFDPITWI